MTGHRGVTGLVPYRQQELPFEERDFPAACHARSEQEQEQEQEERKEAVAPLVWAAEAVRPRDVDFSPDRVGELADVGQLRTALDVLQSGWV
jgi:hypothetical protein